MEEEGKCYRSGRRYDWEEGLGLVLIELIRK